MSIFKEIDWPAELYHWISQSRYQYSLPVALQEVRLLQTSPAHTDRYRHAVDIPVPNPNETQTIVYAPQSGIVRKVVLDNTEWGPTNQYLGSLNFVTIQVGGQEFYQLCHLAPLPGRLLFPNQAVEKGEPIARVGLNGWITVTNGIPDSHVHMLVGRWTKGFEDFTSLRIRWNQ